MGHGGTLDPLATGVLIVGIGRGTKHLNTFLGCTKTYETVVLFGKSTDTYDVAGKVVAEAPTKQITQALVEEKLSSFRGQIKQVPPLYSALKINGMKAYEYARSGKELPRQLESRDMEVTECTMLEWYDEGKHDFRWPAEEAAEEDKVAAKKLMHGAADTKGTVIEKEPSVEPPSMISRTTTPQPADVPEEDARKNRHSLSPTAKAALHTHHLPAQSDTPATAPAARVRLTVSSGFYVRSFAHDLGFACKSYGIMAKLVRSRQGDHTAIDPPPDNLVPTISYSELEEGEEVWGPKITGVLEKWMQANPATSADGTVDDRDRPDKQYTWKQRNDGYRGGGKRKWDDRGRDGGRTGSGRHRNSSSPE